MSKEDITCIIQWFAHIEQLATDRKNANGVVIEDVSHLLNTIKVVAKSSREFVEQFCQHSLPSNLDEAAEKYSVTDYDSDWPYQGIKYEAFKAGSEWTAEQGVSMIITDETEWADVDIFVHRNCDGASIIQIRKKQ